MPGNGGQSVRHVGTGLLAVWLLACGGGASAPESAGPEATGPDDERPRLAVQAVGCIGPVDECATRAGCYVVDTYWRLDESGCFHELVMPAGCVHDDIVASEAVTGAVGPDGDCWAFLNSAVPAPFSPNVDCHRRIFQAPYCSE